MVTFYRGMENLKNGQALNQEIEALFTQIRLIKGQKGYQYAKYAVMRVYEDAASYKGRLYSQLFEDVAQHFDTSVYCVERNIRHVLERTWTKEYTDAQFELYDCVIEHEGDRPSVANFIKRSVAILQERLK